MKIKEVEIYMDAEFTENEFFATLNEFGIDGKLALNVGPNGYPLYNLIGTEDQLAQWSEKYYGGKEEVFNFA